MGVRVIKYHFLGKRKRPGGFNHGVVFLDGESVCTREGRGGGKKGGALKLRNLIGANRGGKN